MWLVKRAAADCAGRDAALMRMSLSEGLGRLEDEEEVQR